MAENLSNTIIKGRPWWPGQWGVAGSDTDLGFRTGAAGVTFYVHPAHPLANDSNDGTDPEAPKSSIQSAIDAAVSGRGDVIMLAPGRHAPTDVIYCNKAGITLQAENYGVNPRQPEASTWIYPTAAWATGPVFIVTQPVAMIGIEAVPRVVAHGGTNLTTGAAVCIDGDAGGESGSFNYFKDCRFVNWWGAPYGIFFWGGSYTMIENCTFEGLTAGVLFFARVTNPTFNDVVGCVFTDCTAGVEIMAGSTPGNILIKSNVFIDYTDAIDFNQAGGGAGNGLVCDNFYETATDAATYDCTVAQAQAIGWNFSGNHYSE